MDTATAIATAAEHLTELRGHVFDVLTVAKPISPEAALNLSKIISKLSPLVGNLIEFNVVEFLNSRPEFAPVGRWRRQDPGFPDAVLDGIAPTPGLEIKAWFPLSTEITARFRDSQSHFLHDNTHVCILAWLPEHVIFGRPLIVDVAVASGLSVARARDEHYHDPPDYVVLEPEDTSQRTANLQQTNTSGHKFQGTPAQLEEATRLVESWGADGLIYQTTREYQDQARQLTRRYPYRLDTNFAKMDRIAHSGIEQLKDKVLDTSFSGMLVREWGRLFASHNDEIVRATLESLLEIKKESAAELLE